MAQLGKTCHKNMVNRLFTLLALALLSLPATAATVEMPVSVMILAPTASIAPISAEAVQSRPLLKGSHIVMGIPGQVIRVEIDGKASLIVLDAQGEGQLQLAAKREITFSYD
jgi:hypothetical protein